jgi:hypothetical protein
MVGAIGWLPWVILGLMKILAVPAPNSLYHRLKWALLTALMLALQLVTHTLIFLYSVYLLAAILTWHLFKQIKWSNRPFPTLVALLKPIFLPLLLIPLVTGLLGAVQLLPLLELAQFSNRALSLDQAAAYAVSPAQLLIGLFLPNIRAGHEQIIYLGLLPLLLAAIGLTGAQPWRWFYGGLLLFAILFALGPSTPVHSFFYHGVPGFGWVRTPARMFFMGAIALSVLVGFGADRLRAGRWSGQAQRWFTRWVIGGGSLALLMGVGLALTLGQLNRAILALTVLIPLGLILMLLRIKHLLSAQVASSLLGLLLFLDLASFDLSLMRFVPLSEALAPGRPVAEYLAQKPGFFRVYSPSYSLPIQTAAAYGLSLADGVEPVHLAVYDEYMAHAGGYHDPSFSVTIPKFVGPLDSALKDTPPDLALLGLLNVEYVASAFPMKWEGLILEKEMAGTFIYRNERALPRAWVAHQALLLQSDWLTQLTHSLARQPTEVVFLENGLLPAPDDFTGESTITPVTVSITHYSANRLDLTTQLDQPGWLVLSELWYPGWQATVNGAAQPVLRLNGLLRGIYLSEPGAYQITVEYRPRSLIWGQWLSSITAVVVLATLGWLKIKGNKIVRPTVS